MVAEWQQPFNIMSMLQLISNVNLYITVSKIALNNIAIQPSTKLKQGWQCLQANYIEPKTITTCNIL